ncbi:uncharacterized protein PHACADRAFT_148180 [Phanerochaete carnosa HHB-10118-sp]|uniref:Signal recognition particle subunit SRP72 n=1 Tax=Phanerochaete carnosa (strain HHB-10118-sp) TaxID=650164 RepID=K5VPY8_PHACS|nr:uncharacterized protein PHACADRAFT_148180 [Phanerochaete carnosa HHB-10118-sp]EKM53538.1 hypothetical protein PHACADRAFT_148180 [Phanerochaete carnosa HHB-10118-sp]
MPQKPKTTSASAQKGKPIRVKKRPAKKEPLPVTERLKRLFTSLCAQIDGGHFSNAIKTCDKILRLEPSDPDALQTKVFLLLQTEQYAHALALIEGNDKYAYEKAYSLYRTNQEAGARNALEVSKRNKGDDDRGVLHLEAQLAYREGTYQAAFDLYNQLLDTSEPSSDEHADILTNLEAAQKHLEFIDSGYLRSLDDLPTSVTNDLESAPPPHPPSAAATLANVIVSQDTDTTKKEKQVRLKRVPKSVVMGVTPPPDPERWLKKSERSNFNAGGKRKKGGGGATQGMVESSAPATSHGSKSGNKGKKKK